MTVSDGDAGSAAGGERETCESSFSESNSGVFCCGVACAAWRRVVTEHIFLVSLTSTLTVFDAPFPATGGG